MSFEGINAKFADSTMFLGALISVCNLFFDAIRDLSFGKDCVLAAV